MSKDWIPGSSDAAHCKRCGQWVDNYEVHDCTGQRESYASTVAPFVIDANITKLLERIAAALEAIAQEMTKPGL